MSRRLLVLLFVLLLSVSCLACQGFAQARTATAAITVVVLPVLEARTDPEEMALAVQQEGVAAEALGLDVGTNDWPIELHVSLLSVERKMGLSFACGIREKQDPTGAVTWIEPISFALSPPILLPSPGWTEYSVTVHITAAADTPVAPYASALRIVLRSASGLVLVEEVPIRVSVLPTPAPTPAPGGGGTWTAQPAGSSAANGPSASETETCSPHPPLVLLVTSEGVTQVDCDALPPLRD